MRLIFKSLNNFILLKELLKKNELQSLEKYYITEKFPQFFWEYCMEENKKTDVDNKEKPQVIIDGNDIIFPKDDMEFYHWMENFLEVATQHSAELGLSQNDLDNIEQRAINFYMSIRNEKIAQEAYNESLTRLEKSRRAYEEALKREQLKSQNPE